MKQNRLGWGISIFTLSLSTLALICSIIFLIIAGKLPYNTTCAYLAGSISIVSIILHSIFFMRKKLLNPIASLCLSVLQIILSFIGGVLYLNASASNFYFAKNILYTNSGLQVFGLIGLAASWIAIIAYLFSLIMSVIRIINKDRPSEKARIRAREKAYEKINQYHDYFQKQIITEEEYNQTRQRILDELKDKEGVAAL